jgi:hypothetical protein
MDQTVLKALVDYLCDTVASPYLDNEDDEDDLNLQACDNTLRLSREWLQANNQNVSASVRWLESEGAYCDCEVLLNVAPRHIKDDSGIHPTA